MGLETFNKSSRASIIGRLRAEQFDLLIIGGGITGASILRDAALRGLRVALVEGGDFASGTSSRSSKLIHGGLRYLKNLGFHLAWQSCHERNLHLRLNKRLVWPVPFLMALYRGQGDSRLEMRAGMWTYEMLSGFVNHRFHRFLSREETLLMAPGLPPSRLEGGCLYYDAVVSDARWTVEIIKDGVRNGGLAVNYAPVRSLINKGGRVVGAAGVDRLTGDAWEISAQVVVNATGVFADKIRQMDQPDAPRLVRLSKGTHLVFNESDVPLSVTTVFHSPIDGRPLFLVQREGCFLYGTTDDWEEGDPGEPVPGERDVSYLLDSLHEFMPEAQLGREKVRFTYSGFRPLVCPADGSGRPSDVSREDTVEIRPSGLISVVGGKLTTARIMAIRILELVCKKLEPARKILPCRTHELSIGGTNDAVAEGLAFWVRQCPRLAPYYRVLFRRYGLDAHEIATEATKIFLGRHPDPHAEPIRAEVQYVCRHEMVCTVEDLIDRRAGFLHWDCNERLSQLRRGIRVIQDELGLSEQGFESQFCAYREHLDHFHALPAAGAVPLLADRTTPSRKSFESEGG
jgi:glycerol-3-phosphate dehydrogenase